jgi:hypothetical protein
MNSNGVGANTTTSLTGLGDRGRRAKAARRGLVLLPIVAAGLLLVAPKAQSAMTIGGSKSAELSIAGSNGYRISVEGRERTVSLSAVRVRTGSSVWTVYAVDGKVSQSGLRARFGKFGRVAVKFKPSGKVKRERPPRGCTGKAAITRLGEFVGTIRFVGERRYTRVLGRRARGSVTTSPAWHCKKRPARDGTTPAGGRAPLPELNAWAGSLSFNAARFKIFGGLEGNLFLASVRDRLGGIRIDRLASAVGDPDSFVADEALTSATVSPPIPFHGTATFQRNPDGTTSLLGSLSVSFPGVDDVVLAGSGFSSKLTAR